MDRLELGARVLDGGTATQTAEGHVASASRTAARELRRANSRHPEVALVRELEAFRHHADHLRGQSADEHRRPNDVYVPAEARRPETVAQDHDGRRSGRF